MQREQGACLPPGDVAVRQACLQFGEIGVLAGGIHHDVEVVRAPRQHQVVIYAALRVHEERVTLLADGKSLQVHRQEAFEAGGHVCAAYQYLPHVRDVEQSGVFARPKVFFDDAFFVLHRHGVSGEGDDFCATGEVPAVECGVFFCAHYVAPM